MAQGTPLKYQEIAKLTSLELAPDCFKFGVCSMESDLYISAKERNPNGEQVITIIELQNNLKYTRKPNKADGLIMHPNQNIIALKAKSEPGNGCMLQIFNMDEKQKLKSIEFPEMITYWKWITATKLACVTVQGVFYVDISNNNQNANKIMDKVDNLKDQGTQIVGYCTDSQEQWGALYGISSNDGGKTINGYIQLYKIQEQKQQILEGHCCTFGQALVHNNTQKSDLFCFVEKKQNESPKLHITEIGQQPQGMNKFKKNLELSFPPEQAGDFTIYMQVSTKHGLIYVVTKLGYLYIIEINSCQQILKTRISQDTIFVGTRNRKTDGFLAINKAGSLFHVSVDEEKLVPFIMNNCSHMQDYRNVGIQLASRYGLPGADGMFLEQFNKCLIAGEYQKAAQIAASSPGTLLRNSETLNKLKQIQPMQGQPQPILIYFQTLLEKGTLNKFESLELVIYLNIQVRPVILQGKKNLIENWLNENKLECSEELGDLVKTTDVQLAIKIYEKCSSKQKLMQSYMETGQMDQAMKFSSQLGIKPDYIQMLRSMIFTDPQGAMNMAIKVCVQDSSINVFTIAEIFLQNNRLAELTQFLLECMKGNKQEDAAWQTQVLELNLMAAPQVAEAILNMEIWNQYNKQKIAILCEQKGLYQKALENFQELKDIKRICLNAHMLNLEWLVQFIGKQTPENGVQILQEMMRHNRQNMQIAVQVCAANYARFQIDNCVKIFEAVSSFDGLFYFLGGILQNSTDKDIHFKYMEAAVKVNQLKEVERVIRDKKDCYDPIRVKDFLKQIKLVDPIPLIVLCDQHGFVEELIKYLYKNNFNRFIEIYILKYNPNSSAVVLGTLIDLECEENYLKQILYNLRGNCQLEPLIQEFEKRNRLRVLDNWLESRVSEGNQLPAIHNAIAKIKIDTNQDPQNFLLNNQFYDSKVVGQYCEDRDPHLAYTAYKRAWGQCDQELIEVTNKNALYRLQARYLVERQSKEVWALVLDPSNQHRKAIIEQVVSAALPESKNVDEVSCTVQAFMQANLPLELLSLLEKIVLHNSEFGQYKKLQHLLIITAIKSDQTRVMDYIKRLDQYDGPAIAVIAIEHELYEEAFEIYRRQNYSAEALKVLLQNIGDVNRASEFADKVGKPEVWSLLGHAYLDNNMAIDCYLKSGETSTFSQVILYGEQSEQQDKFVSYLLMARKNIKDQIIDNALCFAYAKDNKLPELEEFINNPNSTDAQRVGDRCYEEKLFLAAKLFFISVKNNAKIASCLVRLGQFQAAIDSAKKANSPKTWKELCFACIDASEFRLAATAGLNIIVHPDHLEEISRYYEQNGFAEQMIELLQQGMQSERAHIGIFTELGALYAKYQPEKLMEHCVQYFSKINVSKLLRVCERYLLWPEAVYLYSHYDEYDNAINIIIEHSPSAFQHEQFISLIQKVSNQDLFYKAILFYMEEQPQQLNGLLKAVGNKIDLTRTVQVMRRTGYLALITPWMKSVQNQNNQAVNEALNEIYFENEDYDGLRKSIIAYDNFDQSNLAKLTENHQLTEMRRIAAYLYRKAQKFDKSIELSKKDKQYKDCIETAAESEKPETIENLLRFFVQQGEKEFFTVCSYSCYDFIKPDIVLELAWRFNLMDFAMPFMIQVTRDLTSKLDHVQKKHQEMEKKEQKQAQQLENQPLDIGYSVMPGMGQQMLMAPPGQGMFDQGFGQQGYINSLQQGYQQNSGIGNTNNNSYNAFGGFQ